MIRGLRDKHRIIFVVLALLAPALFVWGLSARRKIPTMKHHPPALAIDIPVQGKPVLNNNKLWPDHAVTIRLYGNTGRMVLELEPDKDYGKPDLLVYWSEGDFGSLHEDDTLLGSLSGRATRRFMLPAKAAQVSGRLILYSLGHAETYDQVLLPSMEAYRDGPLEEDE